MLIRKEKEIEINSSLKTFLPIFVAIFWRFTMYVEGFWISWTITLIDDFSQKRVIGDSSITFTEAQKITDTSIRAAISFLKLKLEDEGFFKGGINLYSLHVDAILPLYQ